MATTKYGGSQINLGGTANKCPSVAAGLNAI